MSTNNFSRSGTAWTKREHNALVRAYNTGKTYSDIASLKMFANKRSMKSIRRRMERVEFGIR
jgi:hypothetical protein